ncbi:MAG: peptide-methionine (S)-S-oxide reductase MsrA [Rhodobacteraceae bacterium]|nr:peptide-methionine (S)-S-oxide reductase MsrA [Paracoccaceae bacterium]
MKTQQFRGLALAVGLSIWGMAAAAESITVAGGCFWCVESDFDSVSGVTSTVSGYTGGTSDNPTYKAVSAGRGGHYEAVKIEFDPSTVSLRTLLDKYWRSVDPTDANGQFCDRGPSYRTALFVDGERQRATAEASKAAAAKALGMEIVTPIIDAGKFYRAEDRHQDYYLGDKTVITRFGFIRQSEAYKRYREACGRDKRVKQLWGSQAAFLH